MDRQTRHRSPAAAYRCEACGRIWESAASERLIGRYGGCLACGSPVEEVAIDANGAEHVPSRERKPHERA
jgi:DNA-directed RNA polymerase subunit RPC12/RpoP